MARMKLRNIFLQNMSENELYKTKKLLCLSFRKNKQDIL